MKGIIITTYEELADFLRAFGDGHLNMVVICSPGGYGKTEEKNRALAGKQIVHITGHVTPLRLYQLLFDGRDSHVAFDEIDALLSNPRHVGLLKQLCNTREVKQIMWASADPRSAAIDGGLGFFDTRSHVMMLCNDFGVFNANVGALKTRAMVVRFDPSRAELLGKIKTFARDGEIVAFLDEFHREIPEFNLRTYMILGDLKAGGLDWQRYALDASGIPPKVKQIAELLLRYPSACSRWRRDQPWNFSPRLKHRRATF